MVSPCCVTCGFAMDTNEEMDAGWYRGFRDTTGKWYFLAIKSRLSHFVHLSSDSGRSYLAGWPFVHAPGNFVHIQI
jgi:hypothetical protein